MKRIISCFVAMIIVAGLFVLALDVFFEPEPKEVLLTNNVVVERNEKNKLGDDVYFSYDQTSKTLKIAGTGKIKDFNETRWSYADDGSAKRPWSFDCETVIIGEGITKIGNYIFENLSKLKNAYLPSTLTEIGNGAFSGCTNLYSFTIPKKVETIGESALDYSGIVEINNLSSKFKNDYFPFALVYSNKSNFKSGIVKIGDYVLLPTPKANYILKYNGKEKNLKIPESFEVGRYSKNKTIIYDKAFYINNETDSTIESVEIPKTVIGIGDFNFNYSTVKEINFNEGLEKIGSNCFERCEISSISFPNSLKEIGGRAFSYCSNLGEIKFNEGLEIIESGAFDSTGIISVELPSTLKKLGSAFGYCNNLLSAEIPENLEEIDEDPLFEGSNSLVEIRNKSKFEEDNFKKIKSYLTYDSQNSCIQKIDGIYYSLIDNNLEIIKVDNSIAKLNLPKTVEIDGKTYKEYTIGKHAFYCNNNLKEVSFKDNVKKIDKYAFSECTSLKNIELPKSLYYIGDYAFSKSGLKIVELGETITHIGENAFDGCNSLKKVDIKANIKKISDGCFAFSGIESITIPESVEVIGSGALLGDRLKEINLNSNLKVIGESAFKFSIIESIDIPDSVEKIGESAFEGCEKLKQVKLPSNLKELSYRLFFGSGIESVEIPNTVTKIGGYAFKNCKKLKNITLPANLEIIGNSSFSKTGIESITIPLSVKKIGKNAFSSCSSLISFKVLSSSTKLMKNSVGKVLSPKDSINENLVIYANEKSDAYTYAKNNKIKIIKN